MEKFSMILVIIDAANFHLSAYYDAKVDSLDFYEKLGMPLYIAADQ